MAYPVDLLRQMRAELEAVVPKEEAKAIAFWLLEDIEGITASEALLGDRTQQLPTERQTHLLTLVRRIVAGEPVQYVLGHTDFCGLNIGVEPGVLIPRPETEELVNHCTRLLSSYKLQQSPSPSQTPHIIDLCTGSGCISLALKHRFPHVSVEGWDISEQALKIAKKNAANLGLDITFRKVDVLNPEAFFIGDIGETLNSATLLVSNPPYVCESERADMERNVLDHEPSLALFVPDDDPLRFYHALARWGELLLHSDGWLALEINRRLGNDVAALYRELDYEDVQIHQDFANNDRFVLARKHASHGTKEEGTD